MELVHVPKLDNINIGVWDKMGWYLRKHEVNPSKDIVVFQCQFGHSGRFPAECAIGRDGVVDPNLQCHCLKFDHKVKLDEWPDWFYKLAGQEYVTKHYALSK